MNFVGLCGVCVFFSSFVSFSFAEQISKLHVLCVQYVVLPFSFAIFFWPPNCVSFFVFRMKLVFICFSISFHGPLYVCHMFISLSAVFALFNGIHIILAGSNILFSCSHFVFFWLHVILCTFRSDRLLN